MLAYALRRLAGAVPTIFVIITAAFFMMRIAPGGPFDQERTLEAQVMANLNEAFGLGDPLWKQYFNYIGNLLQGDLGPSFIYRDFSVQDLLGAGLPISIALGSMALLVAMVLGCILGVVAALRQNSPLDTFVIAVATFGITVPNFVVAPVLSLVFGVWLGLLPAGGWEAWSPAHMLLPVITLALPQVAVVARLIRGAMLEALQADHVRTARAYGLPARMVVVVHALRAALAAGRLLPRSRRCGIADRVRGGRDDLRHPRDRALLRPGRAEPGLHAGDGHGGDRRGVHRCLQPRRGPALRRDRPPCAL